MAKLPPDFDWRSSPRHLSCLRRFRSANAGSYSDWQYMIGESGVAAIERFVRDGALVLCGLGDRVAHRFKVSELKEVLRRHGQKSSGDKSELVQAVLAVAQDEMEKATQGILLYQCTPSGLEALASFEQDKAMAQGNAYDQSYHQLLQGDAKAAYATCVEFRRQFLDPSSSGYSGEVERLRFILESAPAVLGFLDQDKLRILRAAAAMKTLWREQSDSTWLPEGFATDVGDNDRAVRLLLRNAEFRESATHHAEWCKRVKLRFDRDDIDLCEHCASLDGTIHDIDKIPELPTQNCTSRKGCICQLDDADTRDIEGESKIHVTLGDDETFVAEGDPVETLRQLKQMLKEELIEQAEYDAKKLEILARM